MRPRRPAVFAAAVLISVTGLVTGATTPALAATAPARLTGDVSPVHDPTMVRAGSDWYVFSTGTGIPIRRSHDLSHWSAAGAVFPGGLPAWVHASMPELGASYAEAWAPDVSFANGRWYLYYAVSVFGTTRSVIGLATNPTLDASDPAYAWTDQGLVLQTSDGSNMNAIDPNAVTDEHGHRWLAWGSFGDGIYVRRVDDLTGRLDPTAPAVNLARRSPNWRGIEGTSIVRRDGWWYLFVSFGSCCNGVRSNYSIHVGRSRHLTGPYRDAAGVSMLANGGTTVTGSYANVVGAGHGTVLEDGGSWLLVHHYYDADADGAPTMSIRPIQWDPDGWPLALDPGFVVDASPTVSAVAGVWHVTGYREELPPRPTVDLDVTLRPDGVALARTNPTVAPGSWRIVGDRIEVTDVVIDGQVRTWWWWIDRWSHPAAAIGRDDLTSVVRGTWTSPAPTLPPSTTTTSTTTTSITTAPSTPGTADDAVPAQPVPGNATFTG